MQPDTPQRPTCGSLFSGIGLLDLGLHLAGWEHSWLCESDPWRRSVLGMRFPGAVVYDDVRTLRGQAAADADEQRGGVGAREPGRGIGGSGRGANAPRRVDLIAGGFPCKGASTAGKREGFEHAETVLWHEMRRVIGEVRPRYVVVENVSNILGMAAAPGEPAGSLWGTVLADLAALGFNVVWDCVPAAAVGAPHLRDRVFAVASQPTGADGERDGGQRRQSNGRADVAGGGDRATTDAAGADGQGTRPQREALGRAAASGRGSAAAADAASGPARRDSANGARRLAAESERGDGVAVDWGDYEPAIERWEAIHGPAPAPLVARVRGVDARSAGRVDRSRLSGLGDGVCVHVAYLVGRYVMSLERERLAEKRAA